MPCPLPLAPVLATLAALAPQDPPSGPRPANRLATERSPYLRLHAQDPVDWYPWGDAAFAKAKAEQKPVLLSIGYTACHWCHVMARESFQDPAIAALLNRDFVCIKVDREERPDVDAIYLAAVEAMGQPGGWPLTVFLNPERQPFFGGTYFPATDRGGRPGFRKVLERLAAAWREQRGAIDQGAAELGAHLAKTLAPTLPPGEPTPALLAGALAAARQRFDGEHGGFGEAPAFAPKFPSPVELQMLLGLADAAALPLVVQTLQAMQRGGLRDQLGGGFHRYCTDRAWRVPHFEQMLYDNALLASTYLQAHQRTGEPSFAATARGILAFLQRELQLPEGGFAASLDAECGGGEGRCFTWTAAEFQELLGESATLVARHFGVTAEPGPVDGRHVLWQAEPAAALAAAAGTPPAAVAAELERHAATLWAARQRRAAPRLDDKVLAGWNGLAIAAFADGYRVLGEAGLLATARRTAGFVVDRLVQDGRCARVWQGGVVGGGGQLEDAALLAEGLLTLFEVDPDPRWLATAQALLADVGQRFAAPDGGLFATAADHEGLLLRARSLTDAPLPSGAAAASRAALRAGLLLGDEALYERGVAVLRSGHALLQESPAAAPALVRALQFHLGNPREVVIAGTPGEPRTMALLAAAWADPVAQVVVLVHDGNRTALEALSKVFAGKVPVDGVPAAYVCHRGVCAKPVTDPAGLRGER